MKKYVFTFLLTIILFLFLLTACNGNNNTSNMKSPTEPEPVVIELTADNLDEYFVINAKPSSGTFKEVTGFGMLYVWNFTLTVDCAKLISCELDMVSFDIIYTFSNAGLISSVKTTETISVRLPLDGKTTVTKDIEITNGSRSSAPKFESMVYDNVQGTITIK